MGAGHPAPEGFFWQDANGVRVLVPEFFAKLGLAGGYSLRRAADGRELDLDLRGGKDRRRILENRRLVSHAMGVDPARLVVGEQVHGAGNVVAGQSDAGRGARAPEEVMPGVDSLVTAEGGLPLATLSADCVLVLLADERGRAAGSVHSGWPGTVAGAVPAAVEAFGKMGVTPQQLYASLGPSIRACCYEVGEDLKCKFAARFPWADEVFTRSLRAAILDLPGAVKRQLTDAGVRPERIFDCGLCTACNLESCYSYRKEGRAAGRIAGVIEIMGKKSAGQSPSPTVKTHRLGRVLPLTREARRVPLDVPLAADRRGHRQEPPGHGDRLQRQRPRRAALHRRRRLLPPQRRRDRRGESSPGAARRTPRPTPSRRPRAPASPSRGRRSTRPSRPALSAPSSSHRPASAASSTSTRTSPPTPSATGTGWTRFARPASRPSSCISAKRRSAQAVILHPGRHLHAAPEEPVTDVRSGIPQGPADTWQPCERRRRGYAVVAKGKGRRRRPARALRGHGAVVLAYARPRPAGAKPHRQPLHTPPGRHGARLLGKRPSAL